MNRVPAITSLVLCLALLGCSADKKQSATATSRNHQEASLGPISSDMAAVGESQQDRVARRPTLQSASPPQPRNDLPLWPPPPAPAPLQPSLGPPNALPPAGEQPAPPWVTAPTNTEPALPPIPGGSELELPGLQAPLGSDNPLRSADPITSAPPAEIPPFPQLGPSLTATNPLREDEPYQVDAPPLPMPAGSSISRPDSALPQLPKPDTQPVTPPADVSFPTTQPEAAAPLLPHAPSESATTQLPPRIPVTSPVAQAAPIIRSTPPRLPRVSIYSSPKAIAEAQPRFQSTLAPVAKDAPSKYHEPSGGAAPPPEFTQPRSLNMGTRNPDVGNLPLANPESAATDPLELQPENPPRDIAAESPFIGPLPGAPTTEPITAEPSTEALPEAAIPSESTEPNMVFPPPAASVPPHPPVAEAAAPLPADFAPAAPIPSEVPTATPTNDVVQAAAHDDPFEVVRVFYGTDRRPVLLNEDSLVARLIRFLPSLVLILLSAFGIGVVIVSRKITWTIGTTALVLLSIISTWHGISETIAIAEQANLEEPKYSTDRSDRGHIDHGICEVSIPKSHDPGELESPTILRLETRFDPARHITLRKTVRLQDKAFYQQIRQQVASSPDREILLFVHGFNVSFEDAARRTAQMAHDLKLKGAPVFFSWPADRGFLLTYGKDEASVSWSAPHLKEFLLELVHETDAKSINLVAHSMGNRALTSALREIDLQLNEEARLFNQVVLAAPDIDADDFRDNIAPAIQRTAKQVTLYASSNDIALGASRILHRNPRAGDASQGLVIVPGIVTIDVSNIDGGPWGHSYYGASDPVLRDLHLLLTSLPPERRTWLKMNQHDGQTYWAFKPLGTARTPARMDPR